MQHEANAERMIPPSAVPVAVTAVKGPPPSTAERALVSANEELRSRNLALTELSAGLINLLDGIDLPVVALDGDLRVQRLAGRTAEVLHLGLEDIGRRIGSYNLGFTGPSLDAIAPAVMLAGAPQEVEVCSRLGRWYALRVVPRRDDCGAIAGVVATYIDIDAVKRSQAIRNAAGDAAQAIVETVRDPLLVLDAELRVHTANRAFFRVFRLPSQEVVGRHIFSLGNGEWNIPELKRLLEIILGGGEAMDGFEVTHGFAHIGRRTMLLNARILMGPEDRARMVVLAIADVTEEKRILEALKDTSRELLRSNADLEQFAAIAAHDLQEPLRTVSSFATLLESRSGDRLDDKGRQYMGYVISGAQRMRELIKAILVYAGVGNQGLKAEQVDSAALARLVEVSLDSKIVGARATIVFGDLPMVVADPVLLTQLFQNLVGNGLKFSCRERLPVITIAAREADGAWVFSVSDNGIGIRAEDAERIFTLFQRVHPVADYPGTGIGLATCRKIVERHGGRLWMESTLGVGTTFTFSLPQAPG
jgi:two-component system CheB/CheR fusion protein